MKDFIDVGADIAMSFSWCMSVFIGVGECVGVYILCEYTKTRGRNDLKLCTVHGSTRHYVETFWVVR